MILYKNLKALDNTKTVLYSPRGPYRSGADADKPKEACGVIACYSEGRIDVANILFYGLQELQHRGQESAGISVFNTTQKTLKTHKDMGLVAQVFSKDILKGLQGNIGVGHVRYSTVGDSDITNTQPITLDTIEGQCVLAHNGTISNATTLKDFMVTTGAEFSTTSDTEIILKIISNMAKFGFPKAIGKTASLLQGSYSLVAALCDKIIGVKDPYGIRPLCIGMLGNNGYVIASETCALKKVGADFLREIEAGEIVTIDAEGVHSHFFTEKNIPAPCAFEQIYFARPDSIIANNTVYETRLISGKLLYQQVKIDADIVLGVPESGLPAAIGYAEVSGIPFEMGIIKNQLSNRSFINPTPEMRAREILIKLNIVGHIVKNKRVIVVDDSLVRGNTSKHLITMLRNEGAKEVHFMSESPPVYHQCYFGIDIASRKELAANNTPVEDLAKEIGADSLNFLSLENLQKAFKHKPHCFGCFTGTYPTFAAREV